MQPSVVIIMLQWSDRQGWGILLLRSFANAAKRSRPLRSKPSMNGFSADPTGAKISGISYATVSCTLQDDGVLGKKRTAPLLGRPSRERQWIFWFLVGWHTEVMSLRLNVNSQTYSSLVISDTHHHISSKPREFYIPTKYLVLQTPAWKIWFIFKDL